VPTFSHPSGNGYTETVDQTRSFILIALLGVLYLPYKRSWMAAFLTFFISHPLVMIAATAALALQSPGLTLIVFVGADLAWAAMMAPLVERAYRQRGWREV
jgi:hypothetical protein